MAHVLSVKDGRNVAVFGIRDILDIVGDCAGNDIQHYLEEHLADIGEMEAEFELSEKEHEKERERQGEHQRSMRSECKEETETLEELLHARRLDRKKLQKASDNIWRLCSREL